MLFIPFYMKVLAQKSSLSEIQSRGYSLRVCPFAVLMYKGAESLVYSSYNNWMKKVLKFQMQNLLRLLKV